MKYLIFFILLFSFAGNLGAQTFVRATTDQSVETTINIAGKDFPGGIGKTGAVYIYRRSSKSGKRYKQYLGYKTPHTFEGQQVYRDKTITEFCVYELNNQGYPKKVVLNKQ